MTQENLAERLQVSVGYVSQVERGTTKINSLTPEKKRLLLKIAVALSEEDL